MDQEKIANFTIWIDADACPKLIKEYIFKMSFKLKIPVCLVANNYLSFPKDGLISLIQVEQGADVADMYIANNAKQEDIVITADIPLAAEIVEKGLMAINPRGELYDEENIRERLAMRNFMQELRDGGQVTGGPAPFDNKSKEGFANSLNKIITKKLKI